jgi:hypothetical protein
MSDSGLDSPMQTENNYDENSMTYEVSYVINAIISYKTLYNNCMNKL